MDLLLNLDTVLWQSSVNLLTSKNRLRNSCDGPNATVFETKNYFIVRSDQFNYDFLGVHSPSWRWEKQTNY